MRIHQSYCREKNIAAIKEQERLEGKDYHDPHGGFGGRWQARLDYPQSGAGIHAGL
jgi:hypothetical protein